MAMAEEVGRGIVSTSFIWLSPITVVGEIVVDDDDDDDDDDDAVVVV